MPERTAEITNSVISQIVCNLKIAKNYVLVGLIMPTSFLKLQGSKTKNDKSFVMPIIAKISDEDSEATGFKLYETIVIDRTDLERGSHVDGFNNPISPSAIYNYINSDPNIIKSADFNQFTTFFTITFKIVPLMAIKGSYDKERTAATPFVSFKDDPLPEKA